jgi:hypothetical protein
MQNYHTKRNTRLRKCVEEIIRSKKILAYEDFDFQTLINLRLGAFEINQIIKDCWKLESDPYSKQIEKWMQEDDTFNPAPEKETSWVTPNELLYKDFKHEYYKDSSILLKSAIELWHISHRTIPKENKDLGNKICCVCPSVIPAPCRYYTIKNTFLNDVSFKEIDVSSYPELKKRRTVDGYISSSQMTILMQLPIKEVAEETIPLLKKIAKLT